MANEIMPAVSPFSILAQSLGSAQSGGTPPSAGVSPVSSFSGGLNNFIAALMKGYEGNQPSTSPLAANAHGYEGNIPSPANQPSGGMLGTWPAQPSPPPNARPNGSQAGQWGGHAQPVPFLNNPMTSMLTTPPPFSGSFR